MRYRAELSLTMKSPTIPSSESERLQLLYSLNLLDTPPEERFDRVTLMAKNLFDVDVCLLSLVDKDRQWIKSKQGTNLQETPRALSFCGHAILKQEIMVINDTLEDERFADNPLVTNFPFIRFYAGIPLGLEDDLKVGTLCIIDSRPRSFSHTDKMLLTDLANIIEYELFQQNINHSIDEI